MVFPLTIEYLRLKLIHPEKNEEELLELFRLSSRHGNILNNPNDPKPQQIEEPEEPEPVIEEPAVLDTELKLKEAQELFKKASEEVIRVGRENPDEHPNEVFNKVYKEILGFDFLFVFVPLEAIHLEENPLQDGFPRVVFPLIIEYLRLRMIHPEKNEDELLELFRLSSRHGNISNNPNDPKPQQIEEPAIPVEPNSLDKAREIEREVNDILIKRTRENPKIPFEEIAEEVYQEHYGFGLQFVEEVLLPIHLEENPEEAELERKHYGALILEYLRIRFDNPEKDEEELLELFRLSSRAGNISVDPLNPKPI